MRLLRIHLSTAIMLSGLFISAACLADTPRFMPAFSRQRVNMNFAQADAGFKQRWTAFAHGRKFAKYTPDFDEQALTAEFMQIKTTRQAVYYENPNEQPQRSKLDYERSQQIMTNGFFKCLHHIAFEYNLSHPSYNSSNVIINGHRFLALEGPQKPAHVNNFLRLLVNYDVKQLVRLTKPIDNGVFKTENYWDNAVKINDREQQILSFHLTDEDPTQTSPYAIAYYATDNWLDFAGIDPQFLLSFVQQVRKDYKPGEIIAIHCAAGVGRTCTFIAAFLLMDEIDKQLAAGIPAHKVKVSVEEMVYKLSLQRAYAVAEPQQYINLHQLVKLYLAQM